MIFEKYPYTEYHEINLDWILREIQRLKEEIDKVGDIDDKIRELEEMLTHLYELLADVIGKDLVDKSLFNLHGQVIADKLSRFNAQMTTQGMCIGEDGNSRPVLMNTFIDANTNTNEVVYTYFDNGAEIGRVTGLNLGHGNSCCYNKTTNKFYVACGGGVSLVPYVMPIALDGTLGSAVSIDGQSCWAITWNQDKFYCMTGSGTPYLSYLYVCDNDFQILEKYEYWQDEEFTYQGLCSDDNFLYLFNGNTIMGSDIEHNINRCSVITKDGRDIKQVYMAYPLEIEEGDFYNGRLYISSNTTHAAIICESDMYVKNRHCAFGEPLDTTDFNKNINTIHVDESYMDFLIDGSSDHPLSAITLIILWLRNSTDRINMKIKTDIMQLHNGSNIGTLAFRRCPNTIFDIDGQSHSLPNLLFDNGTLYLSNAILPGIDSSTSIQFFGNRLVINNITFGVSNSTVVPDKFIEAYATIEMKTININQASKWMFMLNGAGYLRSFTLDPGLTGRYKLLLNGGFTVDGTFPITQVIVDKTWDHLTTCSIVTNDANMTYALADINYPAKVAKITSSTITDVPSSVVGTIVYYEVYVYRTAYVEFTFHMSDNSVVYYRRALP